MVSNPGSDNSLFLDYPIPIYLLLKQTVIWGKMKLKSFLKEEIRF